ncbi:hypothetical protein BG004_007225 [Podila humilis]|nr:hypothetical protein BG004_007225 [Podila humilis]
MSKRPNEEQITKESSFNHDSPHSPMGEVLKESNESTAKRPMKSMKRNGSLSRTISDVDGDQGAKRAFMSNENSLSPPPSSSRPAQDGTDQPQTKQDQLIPELTKSLSAPASSSKAPFGSTSASSLSASTTSSTATRPNIFTNSSFTFNIGSSATLPESVLKSANRPESDQGSPSRDEEGYTKALRGVNITFVKRLQREMESNPITNLSRAFQRYLEDRKAVKQQFLEVSESISSALSQESLQAKSTSSNNVRQKHESSRVNTSSGLFTPLLSSSRIPASDKKISRSSSTISLSAAGGSKSNKSTNLGTARKLGSGFGLPAGKIAATDVLKSGPNTGNVAVSSGHTNPFGLGSSTIKSVIPPTTADNWSIGIFSPLDMDSVANNASGRGVGTPSRAVSNPGPAFMSPGAPSTSLVAAAMNSKAMASPGFMTLTPRRYSSNALGIHRSGSNPSLAPSEGQPNYSFQPSTPGQQTKVAPFTAHNGGANAEGGKPGITGDTLAPSWKNSVKKLQYNTSTEPNSGSGPEPGSGSKPGSVALASSNNIAGNSTSSVNGINSVSEVDDDEPEGSTIFEIRARLFILGKAEYTDLGIGLFRVWENAKTKSRRMTMRSVQSGLLVLNSWMIHPRPSCNDFEQYGEKLKPAIDKNTIYFYALVDGQPQRYALRVKLGEVGKVWDVMQV